MALLNTNETGRFISILGSDGTFREKVDKETPGAKFREYEVKDSKTKETVKGSKWELVYNNIVGHIESIDFFSGDYGKQIHVKISDQDEDVIWAQDVSSQFTEDFLKKLPNVDLSRPVKLVPFAFTTETGKLKKGITLYQGDTKVTNFFYDGVKNVNGYPDPEKPGAEMENDDWKVYFIKARQFLVDYTAKNVIPKLETVQRVYDEPTPQISRNQVAKKIDYPDEEINPEDIPF